LGGSLVLDETDESEGTVEKVFHFIQENPGCHLRKVKRSMSISMGTVQYQLDKLEKLGRITSTRRGLYKYYFPVGLFKENEKEILEVLTQETARKILMYIIEQKNPTQTDIVNSVRISARSVSWHVGRLINLQIIREIKDGRYKRYQLHGTDPNFIITLLRNYYPSIWDKWSMRVVEMFLSLSGGKEMK
jgi:predicted transcriptional regulator